MISPIKFKATKVFQDTWNATQSGQYKLVEQKGSSRSSKTWSDFQVLFLDLYSNPMTICTILRDTQKSCREIIEVDWVKWLSDPMGRKSQLEKKEISTSEFDAFIKDENLIRYFIRNKTNHTWTFKHNNSFIRFTGLDDEDDAMGMTQDICWINEPYNFAHEVYKQLSQRTSKYIIFDWNPKKNHWIDIERKKDNTITLTSTFKDNPFCPEESKIQILSYQPLEQAEVVLNGQITENNLHSYNFDTNILEFTNRQIKEIKRCFYNEKTESASLYHWLVYGKGEKSEKPNRIYKNFGIISDVEFDNIPANSYFGLDFGSAKPSALVEVKFYENNFFTKERLYLPISEMKTSLADELVSIGITKKSIIIADSADPNRITELIQSGFNVLPAIKGPGSVNQGIDFVRSKKNHYTSSSSNYEIEYEAYEWEIINGTNLDRPIKKDDHLLDADRYIKTFLQFHLGIK